MSFKMTMVFRLEPPKGARYVMGGRATNRPDLDNLLKLVMDAAQDAGAFGKGNDPDALVCELVVRKIWAEAPGNPGSAMDRLPPGLTCELVRIVA